MIINNYYCVILNRCVQFGGGSNTWQGWVYGNGGYYRMEMEMIYSNENGQCPKCEHPLNIFNSLRKHSLALVGARAVG